MKKLILIAFSLLLMTPLLMGQAKKYVLFEHFTQAGCPPCVPANEYFEPFFAENVASANHISYHTSFPAPAPGGDPMYDSNPTEIRAMQTNYSINNVPRMRADGSDIGQPTAANQGMIDNAGTSPIRIVVKETEDNGVNTVNVEIQSVGDVDVSKNYRLRVAVIEELIEYSSPPGSNGERIFPNVFREFLANGSDGADINLAETGQSVSFDFEYDVEADWQAEEMYVIAYVQDKDDNFVLNSGRSKGSGFEYSNSEASSISKLENETIETYASSIFMTAEEKVRITVEQESPADWGYIVEINGANVNSGDELALPEGDNNVEMQIKAGAAGVGVFTINTENVATGLTQSVTYTVVSDVTDMIVVTDNAPSREIANDGNLTENYLEGIALTGNQNFGKIGSSLLSTAAMADALLDVEHIYYSIGWTFPPLTDEMVLALQDFLDRGGNLLIAGQDVGWAINDAASDFGTTINQAFYRDYLQTRFLGDGDPNQTRITFNTDDAIYGSMGEVRISAVYGANFLYPDAITPSDTETGSIVWRYNNNRAGAVRVEDDNSKIVNLGVGLEMFADRAIADEFMRVTHDYFHSPSSSVDFLDVYGNVSISATPNPATDQLNLTIYNLEENDFQINVYNVHGLLIETLSTNGKATHALNVNEYANGLYFYQLTDGKISSVAQKFMKQ